MRNAFEHGSSSSCAASFGRHFSHAYHTSVILSADVSAVTSVFSVFIDIISVILKKILYRDTGYANAFNR